MTTTVLNQMSSFYFDCKHFIYRCYPLAETSTKELLKRLSTSTPRRSSLPHLKILDAERLQLASKERTASTGNGNGHVIVERKLEPSNSEDSFWGSDLEEEEELLVSCAYVLVLYLYCIVMHC